LIKARANIDLTEDRGKTPLFYAVERGDEEICKALIQAEANLD
jgi:ankyrin repeat protein